MSVPKCSECEIFRPGFCPRCTYLMDNMRRWRKVAEQLHADNCKHRKSDSGQGCNIYLETLYHLLQVKDGAS